MIERRGKMQRGLIVMGSAGGSIGDLARACGAAAPAGAGWSAAGRVPLRDGPGPDPGGQRRGAGAVHLLDILTTWRTFRGCWPVPLCQGRCRRTGRAGAAARGIRAGWHSRPARRPATRRRNRPAILCAAPFPGYRAATASKGCGPAPERSEFARLLDAAIPGDARIVEVGCGTGQMSLYLARADRRVVGADLTRASLILGAAGRPAVRRRLRCSSWRPISTARASRRRLRRGLLLGGSAPHRRSAAGFREYRRARPTRRPDRRRALQCLRAAAPAVAAGGGAGHRISLDPFRSGIRRPRGRARTPGRLADAISIATPRNTVTPLGRCAPGLIGAASNSSAPIPAP